MAKEAQISKGWGLVSGLARSPNTGPTTSHMARNLKLINNTPWHFTYRFQEQEWSSGPQVWEPCRATTTTTIINCVCWRALLLSFLEIQMIFCQSIVVSIITTCNSFGSFMFFICSCTQSYTWVSIGFWIWVYQAFKTSLL